MKKSRLHRRCVSAAAGFTLIELLVVISIIAVLAALLFAAVGRMQSTASRTKCLSKLRQIQMACASYAGENNGVFPPRNLTGAQGLPHDFAVDAYELHMQKYLGPRNEAMFCPGKLREARNPQTPGYETRYTTYQYFNFKGPFVGTLGGARKPDLTRLMTAPATVPLWGCLTFDNGQFYGHGDVGTDGPHEGMNVIHPEGSAKWVQGSELEIYSTVGPQYYWPKPPEPPPDQ